MITHHIYTLAEPRFGRAKKIRVWKNGDIYNECFDVIINPNILRTWSAVLMYLTRLLKPEFGAVRTLYSLKTKKVIVCFEDLESTDKYIAIGTNSKFKSIKNG